MLPWAGALCPSPSDDVDEPSWASPPVVQDNLLIFREINRQGVTVLADRASQMA
jgi:hypothetical protein